MTLLMMLFCSISSVAVTAFYMSHKHKNNIEQVKEMYSSQTTWAIDQLHTEREDHKVMIESLSEFITINHDLLGPVETVKILDKIHSTSGIH